MDVVLYVLDSLRPDFLGCYGHDDPTSPFIDELADDAVLFENAYATSSWTKASAASILSGEYQEATNMAERFDRLPEGVETIPELLRDTGFSTYGVSANTFVSKNFGLTRGFDRFVDLQEHLDRDDRRTTPAVAAADPLPVPQSEDLNDEMFKIVGDETHRFLFYWSVDTHDPYFVRGSDSHFGNSHDTYVPVTELSQFVSEHGVTALEDLYRDMIRYNDREIGRLLRQLRSEGRYEDALLIITGDHGEAFGEGGRLGHAKPVYEEQIRVPLLVKLPGGEGGGERVESPVSLVDVLPTVTEVAGAELPDAYDGFSLVDVLYSGREWGVRASCHFNTPESMAHRRGDYKFLNLSYPLPNRTDSPREFVSKLIDLPEYLRHRTASVYDLSVDPTERNPLGRGSEPSKMRDERERLQTEIERRGDARPTETWDPSVRERERTEERLRDLGYLE